MLKNKLLLPFLILSYLLCGSVFATEQDTSTSACSCQHGMKNIMKELNLSSDQQAKIQAIKESNKSTIKGDWEKLKSIRLQMNELSSSKTVDENKLNDLINQKTTLMGTMMKNKVMLKNQIFNVFTPEQQQKYKEAVKNMREKKAAHHCSA